MLQLVDNEFVRRSKDETTNRSGRSQTVGSRAGNAVKTGDFLGRFRGAKNGKFNGVARPEGKVRKYECTWTELSLVFRTGRRDGGGGFPVTFAVSTVVSRKETRPPKPIHQTPSTTTTIRGFF